MAAPRFRLTASEAVFVQSLWRQTGDDARCCSKRPKSGSFYVLDHAVPYETLNWATHIDIATSRLAENPALRYENKQRLPCTVGRRREALQQGGDGRHENAAFCGRQVAPTASGLPTAWRPCRCQRCWRWRRRRRSRNSVGAVDRVHVARVRVRAAVWCVGAAEKENLPVGRQQSDPPVR